MGSLKLEKLPAPVKYPLDVAATSQGCFLVSIDKAFAAATQGDFVLSFSADLETWSPVFRHASPFRVLPALGGLLVLHETCLWSRDGTTWAPIELPAGRIVSDGRDGLWCLGRHLLHRGAAEPTFTPIESRLTPSSAVACSRATLFSADDRWWLLDQRGEPALLGSLKRRRLDALVCQGERLVALVDGVPWSCTDGTTFVPGEAPSPILSLASVDGQVVAGGVGAFLVSSDGVRFTAISENAEARFSAIAPVQTGAVVVDVRRHRLFGLAARGSRPTLPSAPRSAPPERLDQAAARQRLATLEAPLLASRRSLLERLRTQAERITPSGGSQPHLVYLDALQEAGDRDAERLATLGKLQQGPRFDACLREYAPTLLGPELANARARWRNGFLEQIALHVDQLPSLLERTASHLLRHLVVRSFHGPTPSLAALWSTVRGLESLHLDGLIDTDEGLVAVDWGDLSPLWPAVGRLRTLSVSGDVATPGALVLPELTDLQLVIGDTAHLSSFPTLQTPRLKTLRLGVANGVEHAWLSDLVHQGAWPELETIALAGPFVRGFLSAIADAPGRLRSCRQLELSGTMLPDEALASIARAFPELRRLDLRFNRLSAEGLARSPAHADRLDVAQQAPDAELTWPPDWSR